MKRKKWLWISLAAGLVVVLIIVNFTLLNKDSKLGGKDGAFDLAKVDEHKISETILASGTVVPADEQKIFLDPQKGQIADYRVKENDVVRAGQDLIRYDNPQLVLEQKKTQAQKQQLQEQVRSVQTQINQLDNQISQARKQGQPQEAISQLEREKQQLVSQNRSTNVEINSATMQLDEIAKQINDLTVKSKIDGTVIKVNKDVAKSETGAMEPVIHVISNQPFKVVGTMTEFDAVRVKPGQPVKVTAKALKGKEWNGQVEMVSNSPSEAAGVGGPQMGQAGGGGNVTSYPFKVAITDNTAELRNGFHVTLEVEISGNPNALSVQNDAILKEGNKNYLYLVKNKKVQRREVKLGNASDKYTEIVSGAKKGDTVILHPTPDLKNGTEVKTNDGAK